MHWHPPYPSLSDGSLLPWQTWNIGIITEAGKFLPRVLLPWSLFTTLYNCHRVVHEPLLLLEPLDTSFVKTLQRASTFLGNFHIAFFSFFISSPRNKEHRQLAASDLASTRFATQVETVPRSVLIGWLESYVNLWTSHCDSRDLVSWLAKPGWYPSPAARGGVSCTQVSWWIVGEGVVPQKEGMGGVNRRRSDRNIHVYYCVPELKDWSIYKILTSKRVIRNQSSLGAADKTVMYRKFEKFAQTHTVS